MKTSLRVLDVEEGTALGAAMLGGLGAGIYRDLPDALATIRSRPRSVEADPDAAIFYDAYFHDVYQHLYEALRPLNHRIHGLIIGDDAGESIR